MSDESVADVQGTDSDVAPGAHNEVTEAFVEETALAVETAVEVEAEAPAPVVPDPVHEPEVAEETPKGLEPDGKDDAEKQNALDKKLARENQALRKRMRDAEAKVKEYEEAQLSEQEKQQRRLAELEDKAKGYEARLRESSLNLAVSSAVTRFNIIDPDVVKLLDTSTLEYDDEVGEWIGIDDAIATLVEEKPWLVRPEPKVSAPKDANPANPARRRTRLTRDALAKMSQAEINALSKEEIDAALASE